MVPNIPDPCLLSAEIFLPITFLRPDKPGGFRDTRRPVSTKKRARRIAHRLWKHLSGSRCAGLRPNRRGSRNVLPDGELCGRLRIAVPLTFGQTHLAPVIADMARHHPQLHVHTSYSDRFVDLIAEGFDCAIRIGYLHDSDLMARHVGPICGSLVASPDYIEAHGCPEKPEELVEHQALMQGTESWRLTDGNKIISVHPQGRFKADNGTALVAAALAGLGIAWLPNGIMRDHIASGALVAVMTRYPPPPAGIYVIRPPSQQPPRKVRVLTEMLVACFGQASDVVGRGPCLK